MMKATASNQRENTITTEQERLERLVAVALKHMGFGVYSEAGMWYLVNQDTKDVWRIPQHNYSVAILKTLKEFSNGAK